MADPGDSVYPTVAQLRAVGIWVETAGLVTGMDYRDSDDQYDLLSGLSRSFAITEASAQAVPINASDLTLELRVPPINVASRYADCDWNGVSLARRNNVGIYGPNDALAHDDWIGSDGVGSADVSGQFSVTGAGDLTLSIPSEYEQRMDEVPLGTAPVGPPTIYWIRKANYWYPTRSFNEGVYCWLGWERLDIPITCPVASGSLTLTITYRTYTFSDNHVSDSTRVSTFGYGASEHTETYALSVVSGAQTVHVPIVAKDPYPLFEMVVSIGLSGFDVGTWTIGEPMLVQSSPSQCVLKTFEGYEYQHGGASFHLDAAYELYDANEANLGSDNFAEKTVRFFDRVTGAGSGLDLTVAYQLSAYANLLEAISEVFTASRYDTGYYAAVRDGESPPNTLSSCWGFNICYANAESPGSNPLEQAISSYANCALRCGTWVMVRGTRYRMLPDKIVDGRAHGNALASGDLNRSATAFSNLYRMPPGGSSWQLVQALNSDAYGHWTSQSLPEFYDYQSGVGRRWRYGIGPDADNVKYVGAGGYAYVREYIAGLISISSGGVCCFHQLPNFLYVFYTEDGIKHVYNAPPDFWFTEQQSQAHYALPKTDTTDDDTSPSGYVDGNGTMRVFFVRASVLTRLDSADWGKNWGTAVATPISADRAFAFRSADGISQVCFYVYGGSLRFAASEDHFDAVQEDVLIASGVDDAQPTGYHNTDGNLYAYAFVGGVLTCWRSQTRGRTWAEQGTV